MVSNRSFDRLNLTHKRTTCVSLLLFLFFKEIVRGLPNIVWLSLPIIADCLLYFESDENRSFHREELNLLFWLNFYTMQFSMFAFHLTRNSFIIPRSNSSVNNFFQVFKICFFVALSLLTAFIYYQTIPQLSTAFFIFFDVF